MFIDFKKSHQFILGPIGLHDRIGDIITGATGANEFSRCWTNKYLYGQENCKIVHLIEWIMKKSAIYSKNRFHGIEFNRRQWAGISNEFSILYRHSSILASSIQVNKVHSISPMYGVIHQNNQKQYLNSVLVQTHICIYTLYMYKH